MDDLIKRQDAINSIESHIRTGDELYPITETDKILNHAFEISASCIYNMPSAEPVIRCKDCEHDCYCCRLSSRTPDDYCSHAERKNDE